MTAALTLAHISLLLLARAFCGTRRRRVRQLLLARSMCGRQLGRVCLLLLARARCGRRRRHVRLDRLVLLARAMCGGRRRPAHRRRHTSSSKAGGRTLHEPPSWMTSTLWHARRAGVHAHGKRAHDMAKKPSRKQEKANPTSRHDPTTSHRSSDLRTQHHDTNPKRPHIN